MQTIETRKSPYYDDNGVKKGPWTPEEDQKLLAYIQIHGHGRWSLLPLKAGLQRYGRSCRLRWKNYLRPDIKRGKFSREEDRSIIQLHALMGNRWSAIAAHIPNRTDNEIKNYWNSHLKKRLTMMGVDPVTHKPKLTTLASPDGDPKTTSNLSHMAQWESTRLEAEARLGRNSNINLLTNYDPHLRHLLISNNHIYLNNNDNIIDQQYYLHQPPLNTVTVGGACGGNDDFTAVFESVNDDDIIGGVGLFNDQSATHPLGMVGNDTIIGCELINGDLHGDGEVMGKSYWSHIYT